MSTVLIVDDSATDRQSAGRALGECPDLKVEYAGDGADALERFRPTPPDIVVTDLDMPTLDGLQLIEIVRKQYPLVPVIVLTEHGQEERAVQALTNGAASYVPKAEIERHLLETVQGVLTVAHSHRLHRRLMGCLDRREMNFVLNNDSALIPPLVDQVQQVLANMRLVDETGRVQVAVALEEALCNALYHGNLELASEDLEEFRSCLVCPDGENPVTRRRQESPYKDRKIHVHASFTCDEVRFTIRDEGPGFDPASAPDPHDPATVAGPRGHGLVLMENFMDEVIRNPSGNVVELVKRRTQPKDCN